MESVEVNNMAIVINAVLLVRRILEQANGAGFTIPDDISPENSADNSDIINSIITKSVLDKINKVGR